MSAAGRIALGRTFHGLRPAHARRDSGAVADLIETCFADTLDASARSAIREMRWVGRAGPLVWSLGRLSRAIPLLRGFVWVEAGRIVGNVTLTPAGYGGGWVIANVAVYPEYRRRGIARQLMEAALDGVARWGRFGILQVDADNAAALGLYESLGFCPLRTFTRWRRGADHRLPPDSGQGVTLRRLSGREVPAAFALAQQVRPDARGGLGWLRPTRQAALRPVGPTRPGFWLDGKVVDLWTVPGPDGEIAALVRSESRLGGLTRMFDLLVHPAHQGALEPALVTATVRTLAQGRQGLITDHPADDTQTGDLLAQVHFQLERTLVHMQWPAP